MKKLRESRDKEIEKKTKTKTEELERAIKKMEDLNVYVDQLE